MKIAISALVAMNLLYLEQCAASGNRPPRIAEAGVVFEEERPGEDDYQTIEHLLTTRKGDCEDIVAAVVAERIMDGDAVWFDVLDAGTRNGKLNFHVVMQELPTGKIVDIVRQYMA